MKRTLLALMLGLSSSMASASVTVSDCVIREPAPGANKTGLYFTLTYQPDEETQSLRLPVPEALYGAVVPQLTGHTELHDMKHVDGVMTMTRIPQLPLKPGTTVSLKPGGHHVMLFDLKQRPAAGEEYDVEIWLAFAPDQHTASTKLVRCVRADNGAAYHNMSYVDNGDGTVTEKVTNRMWQQKIDYNRRNWFDSIEYCENLNYAGYDDWRLPNIKELVEKKHWSMDVESVPEAIIVAPDGARLAVALKDKIVMIEPLTGRYLETIPNLAQPYSVNFDTGGYNLYITEQTSGRTLIWRVHDAATREIQLGSGGEVSEVTLSPDARLVMVGDLKKNTVTVWDLFMEQEFAKVTLEDTPWRPYVSSDSEHMILAAENGQGLVVNSWSGQTVKKIDFKDQTTEIRTGWLESIGVVATTAHCWCSIYAKNPNYPPSKQA
ncbi:copper chaperone PCu(A)C [Vibrio alfacsensis]|uniref:copper chaperone PCu(A)C n=1 Tax=Vibrio alfacsensis TaxID=1074311 RepID=UPI004068D9B3